MYSMQGDEGILEKIINQIINVWKFKVSIEIKIPLRKLFPEPENKWLSTMWSHGHADIAVYRHGKLVCIIEPGGWFYHLKDKTQKLRDKRKDKLCEINGVNVLRAVNDIVDNLDLPVTKKLFKKYIYG